MASTCFRLANRTSLSLLRSHISKVKKVSCSSPLPNASVSGSARAATSADAGTSCRSSFRRFRLSRCPSELGCCGDSMYPLHSAVALARLNSRLSLTSRSCRDLSQVEKRKYWSRCGMTAPGDKFEVYNKHPQ